MSAFKRMSLVLESNPRRLKRVMQTFTLVTEVARRKPQSEEARDAFIGQLPAWPAFSSKLVKWTCLCELYPYRMSLLVLLVLDFEQKSAMCRLAELREQAARRSGAESPFFYRYNRIDAGSARDAGGGGGGGDATVRRCRRIL